MTSTAIVLLVGVWFMTASTSALSLSTVPNAAVTNINATLRITNQSTALAVNCFTNMSSGVLCQLFTNATNLQTNLNSTVYLQRSRTNTTAVSQLPSECFSYTSITDGTRNAAATGSGGCDNATFTATPMWVRFSSPAGTMLANYAIEPFHCGANSPGWFNGSYPTTGGQTIDGTVCYAWVARITTCLLSLDQQPAAFDTVLFK